MQHLLGLRKLGNPNANPPYSQPKANPYTFTQGLPRGFENLEGLMTWSRPIFLKKLNGVAWLPRLWVLVIRECLAKRGARGGARAPELGKG